MDFILEVIASMSDLDIVSPSVKPKYNALYMECQTDSDLCGNSWFAAMQSRKTRLCLYMRLP